MKHFLGLLDQGGEVGKKLDFLLQEMNREANTLLSKTSGLAGDALKITEMGLAMKIGHRESARTGAEHRMSGRVHHFGAVRFGQIHAGEPECAQLCPAEVFHLLHHAGSRAADEQNGREYFFVSRTNSRR